MANFDPRYTSAPVATADAQDAGLRAYMLHVYNYMLAGLAVTGIASWLLYAIAVTTNPADAVVTLQSGVMLTSVGQILFLTPLRWVVMFSPVALVLLLQFRLSHMSVGAALAAFVAYAGLVGVSMGTISLIVYTGSSIAQVFFITAAAFGGLSLFGYSTKRDLSGFGSFLIMGVWGLFIAFIVNIWLKSPMLMWVASVAGVFIFAGMTAYDTQSIKNMYYVGDDGTVTGRKAVTGALRLYLDFINMFMMLLNLMGNRR